MELNGIFYRYHLGESRIPIKFNAVCSVLLEGFHLLFPRSAWSYHTTFDPGFSSLLPPDVPFPGPDTVRLPVYFQPPEKYNGVNGIKKTPIFEPGPGSGGVPVASERNTLQGKERPWRS